MRMKKNILFMIGMAAGLVSSAVAQECSYDGMVTIVPVRLEQAGDSLYIEMDFVLDDVKVKSARGFDFIPQLTSPSATYNLPRVSIKGPNEYLAHERKLALMSKKELQHYEKPYLLKKGGRRMEGAIRYRYALPYEPWMKEARLDVQRDECGCGETALMAVEQVVDKVTLEYIPVPYVMTPHMAYVEPKVESVKNREIQTEAFLDFEVNKTNIRPEYMNNPRELAKIRAMIDELKSDDGIRINRLNIIGYASPEGTLESNKRLSEGRAMALRDYLAACYDFPRNQYHILFGGENWEGFVQALDTIDMNAKAEVLAIIEHTPIERGRETKLMQLRGGVPYRYLLKKHVPRFACRHLQGELLYQELQCGRG